ncbi:MAG TPA: hypothetical protein PLW20_03875, partial [Paludibacteraceae bacterium]|nr:hypothetical protein [Paludibacteraceae bacterium]
MKKLIVKPLIIAFQIILILLPTDAKAQYFGRNKPSYQTFKYQIKQTPHFEIYHYLTNDTVIKYFAGWTEEWYRLHQLI